MSLFLQREHALFAVLELERHTGVDTLLAKRPNASKLKLERRIEKDQRHIEKDQGTGDILSVENTSECSFEFIIFFQQKIITSLQFSPLIIVTL